MRVIGHANLPGRVPVHASQMYSNNVFNLVQHFWDDEAKRMRLDRDDEIMAGALVTHDGEIVSRMLLDAYRKAD